MRMFVDACFENLVSRLLNISCLTNRYLVVRASNYGLDWTPTRRQTKKVRELSRRIVHVRLHVLNMCATTNILTCSARARTAVSNHFTNLAFTFTGRSSGEQVLAPRHSVSGTPTFLAAPSDEHLLQCWSLADLTPLQILTKVSQALARAYYGTVRTQQSERGQSGRS